jgi:hypothetical protein
MIPHTVEAYSTGPGRTFYKIRIGPEGLDELGLVVVQKYEGGVPVGGLRLERKQ